MLASHKKAVLVDCFGENYSTECVLADAEKLITDENCYVFVITTTDMCDAVSDVIKSKLVYAGCQVVTSSCKIGAFYKAKRDFDLNLVEYVSILCCEKEISFWTSVCNTLLTPVHQWEIHTLPKSDRTNSEIIPHEVDLKVTIANYLQTLSPIGELKILRSPLFVEDKFVHGFTTRNGGITTIPTLSSLNLHYTDKKRDSLAVIKENIRRVASVAGFDLETFHTAKPEHGNAVWVMGTEEPLKYDAIVTNQRGVTIAAPGADCMPVIFTDPVKMACGVVHSGYRGTVKAAVVETLRAMVKSFNCDPHDVRVAMGPVLGPCCAVMKPDDPTVPGFEAISSDCVRTDCDGKAHLDMLKASVIMLHKEGILPEHTDETAARLCTCCYADQFYSHKRDAFPFGNQVGFVGIL